jgi:hypothetical protein
MTSSEVRPDGQKSTLATWRTRILGGLAVIVVLIVAYFILAAFIPRWWAQRLAEMVSGSFSKGIGWGLVYGGLFTAIPLFLLMLAALMWRRRAGKVIAGAAGVLAVLAAIPNLMTLSIVLGDNSAAHAGQRILDVVFLLAVFIVTRRAWRRKHPAKPVTQAPPPQAVVPPSPKLTTDKAPTRHDRM